MAKADKEWRDFVPKKYSKKVPIFYTARRFILMSIGLKGKGRSLITPQK